MIKEGSLEKYISGTLNLALSPIPVPLVGGLVRGRALCGELLHGFCINSVIAIPFDTSLLPLAKQRVRKSKRGGRVCILNIEFINTPLSPPSQGGDEGDVFHRLFTIIVMGTNRINKMN